MNRAGGLLGPEDQEATFCVDDLFSPPPAAEADDLDFVTNWIDEVIDQPNGPLVNPVENFPLVDVNTPETPTFADPLSPSDSGLDFLSNETPHNQNNSLQPVVQRKQEGLEDSILAKTVPVQLPEYNSQLQLRSHGTHPPLFETLNSAGIPTTASSTNGHPQHGRQPLRSEAFPFGTHIGEGALPTKSYVHNCTRQNITPPRQSQIQAGTPLTTSSSSAGLLHEYNDMLPTREVMPPPPLAISCVPDFQFLADPSTRSTFTPNSTTNGTPHSNLFRIPSASSGTSYVTQASVPATPGTPREGAKAKNRYSKGASASNYCHVCGRNSRIEFAVCSNTRVGLCRKVVCDKCLLLYERDSFDVAKDPRHNWKCTHCRNVCPPRARCKQYTKNNHRRRARKAEAALREAQNRQRAQQSRQQPPQDRPKTQQGDQQLQQGRQQAQKKSPKARQSRKQTQQNRQPGQMNCQQNLNVPQPRRSPPKPQKHSRILPPIPLPAHEEVFNLGEGDMSLLDNSQVHGSVGSCAGPSSQHDDDLGNQFLVKNTLPLPAQVTSPVNAKKRAFSQTTDLPIPADTQSTMAAGVQMQIGRPALQRKIQNTHIDQVTAELPVVGRSDKRRRITEPFLDGISPVSIANIMMSGNYEIGNFAETGFNSHAFETSFEGL